MKQKLEKLLHPKDRPLRENDDKIKALHGKELAAWVKKPKKTQS